jgi:glycosyltransferase involved in cell wall biosynthesis
MPSPLISIICISHNHAPYIEETLRSAISQTYENVEIILIDDGSSDGTPNIIEKLKIKNPKFVAILLSESKGNCRAFNKALNQSKGDYIIDLAADDLLMPERIAEGIACFQRSGKDYGVNFTDAAYIDASGRFMRYHYKRNKSGQLYENVPEGSIYEELLSRYFICTPTMMIRRSVFEHLGGYDENLAYEDFDFWVRSAKVTKYCYTDQVLVKKRILKDSLSTRQYKRNSQILKSTYLVCLKAEKLNETESERKALARRVQFEFKMALLSKNYRIAYKFSEILIRTLTPGMRKFLIVLMNRFISITVRNDDFPEEGDES